MRKPRRGKPSRRELSESASAASQQPSWTWPAQVRPAPALALAMLAVVVFFAAFQVFRLTSDPKILYLSDPDASAQWIRSDEGFWFGTYNPGEQATIFAYRFVLDQRVTGARLSIRALQRFEVKLDGKIIYSSPPSGDGWKQRCEVPLETTVTAGEHELTVLAVVRNAHPCIWVHSPELGIATGRDWTARKRGPFRPVFIATEPVPPHLALTYPSVTECFVRLAPWLAMLFAAAFAGIWWSGTTSAAGLRRWFTPAKFRWCLLAGWVLLAANNIGRVPTEFGYDHAAHCEYIQYIAQKGALPLATEGWQMFQAPLFYVLAAPVFAALSFFFSDNTVFVVLRILPLLCGLAQIELVYRIARAVFPQQADLQVVATMVGGLMPMHIYISQVIGNEPLAGCLTSLTILWCMLLLADSTRPRTWRFFAALGVIWGLALLAKVTPILLAPLVVATVIVHARNKDEPFARGILRAGGVMGVALLTAGWYFLRNMYFLGSPFVGGWDPASGNDWWQDPSYRSWAQFSSIDTLLSQPVYSGCWSLWAALHSTLWLDGFTSGVAGPPSSLPWNYRWMMIGAWLGFLPLSLIAGGFFASWYAMLRDRSRIMWFPVAAVLLYLMAFIQLYVGLPVYSTGKGTYLLGILPCLALLAAVGAAPLLRFRLLRVVLFSALSCWAVASYVAYFSLSRM